MTCVRVRVCVTCVRDMRDMRDMRACACACLCVTCVRVRDMLPPGLELLSAARRTLRSSASVAATSPSSPCAKQTNKQTRKARSPAEDRLTYGAEGGG